MLNGPEMKARFQSRIQAGLSRVFSAEMSHGKGYPPIAQEQWALLADALSDIAMDIVNEIQTKAEVQVGIQVETSGGPANQSGQTISLGKIL